MSTKVCEGFFKFYLDLELFAKIKKDMVSTHSCFTLLLITQDLSIVRGNPTRPFVSIAKYKACAKFQRGISNSMVVEAR